MIEKKKIIIKFWKFHDFYDSSGLMTFSATFSIITKLPWQIHELKIFQRFFILVSHEDLSSDQLITEEFSNHFKISVLLIKISFRV